MNKYTISPGKKTFNIKNVENIALAIPSSKPRGLFNFLSPSWWAYLREELIKFFVKTLLNLL